MKRRTHLLLIAVATVPVFILGSFTLALAEDQESSNIYDPSNVEVLYEGRNIGIVDLSDPEIYGAIEAQPHSFRGVMPEVEGFVGGDELTFGIGPAAYTVNGPRSEGANPPSYVDPNIYNSDIYVDKLGNPIDPNDLGDADFEPFRGGDPIFSDDPGIGFDGPIPEPSNIDPSGWDIK